MDPHILELITKIGAPGGATALLAFLVYVLYAIYQDLKKVQEERIEDAKKYNDAILADKDKTNETYSRVADTIEKIVITSEKSNGDIRNDIEKLALTVEDIEQAVKELKDKA